MDEEVILLGKFLKDIPPDKKIRIGTKDGSGFIYAGTKENLSFKEVWKDMQAVYAEKIYQGMVTFTKTHERTGTFERILDDYYKMKWLPERKVIDHYPGQFEPDAEVIIIEGSEKLFDYLPDKRLYFKDFEGNAVNNLYIGIYKGVYEELISAYMTLKSSKSYELKAKARANVRHLANWIRSDPYGMLTNPEGHVKACKIAAEQRLEEKENENNGSGSGENAEGIGTTSKVLD